MTEVKIPDKKVTFAPNVLREHFPKVYEHDYKCHSSEVVYHRWCTYRSLRTSVSDLNCSCPIILFNALLNAHDMPHSSA